MKSPLSYMVGAGLVCACAAEPMEQVEAVHARSATKIEAMRTDGSLVLGQTIHFSDVAARGGCVPAFDQLSSTSVCGFGDVYPQSGVIQNVVEDVIPASGEEWASINEFSIAALRPLCDGGTGTTAEVCQIIVESWEVVDNVADLDGSDGFASDTPGLVTPMRMSDTDGDTFIDEFNGGVILTYANTDTDGDTLPDAQLSSGAGGYTLFFATGLDTLGVPMPSGVDANTDGRPDGGIKVSMTRGDGGDGNGPMMNGFYPTTNARILFGATAIDDPSGCLTSNGVGQGASDGILWAEGYSQCNGGPGWSDGSASSATDDLYDPLVDVKDISGTVVGLDAAGIAMKICTVYDGGDADCCDVNGDGACTGADFTAWLNAYHNGLPTCDINQDGGCGPNDFPAWLNAYNNSIAGMPITCTF